MSVLRLKINHNVDASPSLAKTRYLIHSKQDVANIQTEEQKTSATKLQVKASQE